MSEKKETSSEMSMSKSNRFDQNGKEPDRINGASGDKSAPGSKARRSLKYPLERPKSLATEPVHQKKTDCSEDADRGDSPQDLSHMFCNLLLTPEEMRPIEEREDKVVALSAHGHDDRFKDAEDPTRKDSPNVRSSNDNFNDSKPALAERDSDLTLLSSGVPPPLKSLFDEQEPVIPDVLNMHQKAVRVLETLEREVVGLQTRVEEIRDIDQFIQKVCESEDQAERPTGGNPDNNK